MRAALFLKKVRGAPGRLLQKGADWLLQRRITASFQKLHGEEPWHLNDEQFFVFAVMKDSEVFIAEFVQHYTQLGAAHIFLVDNCSTDQSREIAKKYSNVTVYSTAVPFLPNECLIRRMFLERFLWGNWVICVDVDEHFRYCNDSQVKMPALLAYLNEHKFTAVTACMLDMFQREAESQRLPSFESCRYFTTENIERNPYPRDYYAAEGNTVPPSGLHIFRGGIRKTVSPTGIFGLLKHPLIKLTGDLLAFSHPHFSANARLADVTSVLLHYKMVGDYKGRLRDQIEHIEAGEAWHEEISGIVEAKGFHEYARSVADVLDRTQIDVLYDRGFLSASPQFKKLAGSQE